MTDVSTDEIGILRLPGPYTIIYMRVTTYELTSTKTKFRIQLITHQSFSDYSHIVTQCVTSDTGQQPSGGCPVVVLRASNEYQYGLRPLGQPYWAAPRPRAAVAHSLTL